MVEHHQERFETYISRVEEKTLYRNLILNQCKARRFRGRSLSSPAGARVWGRALKRRLCPSCRGLLGNGPGLLVLNLGVGGLVVWGVFELGVRGQGVEELWNRGFRLSRG